MGRIKITLVKSVGHRLINQSSDKFYPDYELNKKALKDVVTIPSKKLRNILAGYVTRLKRLQKN